MSPNEIRIHGCNLPFSHRPRAALGKPGASIQPLALAEPGSLADRSTIGHVLLRDPNLPEAMLPLDWPGRTARGLCHTLYGALLDVSEAYLHRVVEVADGSLLDANRSLRLRFGAGAQAADGN